MSKQKVDLLFMDTVSGSPADLSNIYKERTTYQEAEL